MSMPKALPKRSFDIAVESQRIGQALAQLKASQQPGEASGKGNKTQVLQTQITEIEALVSAGYSVRQIAAAISNDVFGILPKSITQLLNRRHSHPSTRGKASIQRSKTMRPIQPVTVTPVAVAKSKQVTEIGDVE
jgi:hypothetical protein